MGSSPLLGSGPPCLAGYLLRILFLPLFLSSYLCTFSRSLSLIIYLFFFFYKVSEPQTAKNMYRNEIIEAEIKIYFWRACRSISSKWCIPWKYGMNLPQCMTLLVLEWVCVHVEHREAQRMYILSSSQNSKSRTKCQGGR